MYVCVCIYCIHIYIYIRIHTNLSIDLFIYMQIYKYRERNPDEETGEPIRTDEAADSARGHPAYCVGVIRVRQAPLSPPDLCEQFRNRAPEPIEARLFRKRRSVLLPDGSPLTSPNRRC